MYICRESGGPLHREVTRFLKAASDSTVTTACAMMRTRLEHDRGMRNRIRGIIEELRGGNG